MRPLHIGIDFDNTIACYDGVFYKIALEQNLIPHTLSSSKTAVRDYLRSMQQEEKWTFLQGYVYGSRMDSVQPFSGIDSFFSLCQTKNIKISIVSHKTKHPYLGPLYDLHQSAKNWLEQQSFFHSEIKAHFELTLPEKLERIETEKCDFFIDDLPELLNEPTFPKNVGKILFDPSNHYLSNPEWLKINSWDQMPSILPRLISS